MIFHGYVSKWHVNEQEILLERPVGHSPISRGKIAGNFCPYYDLYGYIYPYSQEYMIPLCMSRSGGAVQAVREGKMLAAGRIGWFTVELAQWNLYRRLTG